MIEPTFPQLPLTYLNVLSFCNNVGSTLTGYNIAPAMIRNVLFAGKGWKLTKVGLELITKKFKPYSIKNEKNKMITGKILLHMDQCCNSPWSLFEGVVTVFDPTLYFELQMVDGDINAFIDFKSI